jgi:pyruvate formate lyase activating enzyme
MSGLHPGDTIPTRYFHTLEDGRVQCDVCPRACRMHEGQRGLCFVRANQGGQVVLTTYGRSSGFCVDPIEKKPLSHFLPGSAVLSFGTAGCNLTCRFCQNWDISKSRELDTLQDEASPETIATAAHALGCESVAFTYNDPTIFMEYAIDVAKACHERGVRTVSVTAGYICGEPRRELYRHIDAANVDLKGFSEEFYFKVCGGRLAPVLETLVYLEHETEVWLELTTLLIPGHNDSDRELDEMTRWVVAHLGPEVPMHFTAFHPDYKMLDVASTPAATLTRARRIAMGNGVRYAYTGNVSDAAGQSTYCHLCGGLLIGRDGYEITSWQVSPTGRCRACGTACAGVFGPRPGRWGARRRPVRLSDFVA